jgi:hypothetical protein
MSKNPWDVREPPAKIGDPDETPLFEAVGRALTTWETVEIECARLFAVFVATKRKYTYHDPAVRAYGAIIGAVNRKNMLEFAAEPFFARRPKKKASFQKRSADLIKEYIEFSARRNEIAHGLVRRIFITRKGGNPKLVGIYLIPSFFNPKKFKKGELTYAYVSGDVIYYKQEFDKLQLRFEGLVKSLS